MTSYLLDIHARVSVLADSQYGAMAQVQRALDTGEILLEPDTLDVDLIDESGEIQEHLTRHIVDSNKHIRRGSINAGRAAVHIELSDWGLALCGRRINNAQYVSGPVTCLRCQETAQRGKGHPTDAD